MAFAETRLDLGVNYGVEGGPKFQTIVIIEPTGKEQRICQRINPLHSYSYFRAENRPINEAELRALQDFHNARTGALEGFRFKDWNDFQTREEVLGVGDGDRKKFQLLKVYAWGGNWIYRPITKPVVGTVVIKINGVETQACAVDPTTGLVILDQPAPNGAVVTGACEFDVPCRFATDDLKFRFLRQSDTKALYTLEPMQLIEIRSDPSQQLPVSAPPVYIGQYLPVTGYDYGSTGGPRFSTQINSVGAGFELRTQEYNQPRRQWDIAPRIINKPEAEALLAAFWVCRGQGSSFLYLDRHQQPAQGKRVRFANDALRFRFERKAGSKFLFNSMGFTLLELT